MALAAPLVSCGSRSEAVDRGRTIAAASLAAGGALFRVARTIDAVVVTRSVSGAALGGGAFVLTGAGVVVLAAAALGRVVVTGGVSEG